MRRLLDLAGWQVRRERDLELYLPPDAPESAVLVLDNDLPWYRTTVEDVVLRKSPLIKEMISFRNIRRILNDADVVVRKKADTVAAIQAAAITGLDLSHSPEDIAAMALDGAASLESRYAEGVTEALELFAEILGYTTPPVPFTAAHHHLRGRVAKTEGGTRCGPMTLYSLAYNHLSYIDRSLSAADDADVSYFEQIVQNKARAAADGIAVFKALEAAVARQDAG